MTDEQQAPVGADLRQRLAGLTRVEAACERRGGPQAFALLVAPLPRSELRCLARTRLGAEQHNLEARTEPRQGEARGSRLALAARGQPPLSVRARAVGLGLRVTY